MRKLFLLLAIFLTAFAWAHPANVASSQIKMGPDGKFTVRIRFDLAAFATNAAPKDADDASMHAFLDAADEALKRQLADAESRFRSGFGADAGGQLDQLDFPVVADVRQYLANKPEPRIPMMMTVTLTGHVPPGSKTVAFRYPALLDTVIQTVEFPYTEPISEPVESNHASSTLKIPSADDIRRLEAAMNGPRTLADPPKAAVSKAAAPKPAKLSVPAKILGPLKPAKVQTVERPSETPAPVVAVPPSKPKAVPAPPKLEVAPPSLAPATETAAPSQSPFLTYLRMGFTHILPEGIDHILFVLGLFLLGSNSKALLKQITAFTVAHSITLALTTLKVIHLPQTIIEPVIALSIAFVAIENLFIKDVKPWRTAIVFMFGLVHGMGFAEVFAEAGLRGGGLLTALVSFNVGVELGQLSVVAMALLAVGWFRKDQRYRQVIVVPASLLIAALALFWTVERVWQVIG